MDNLGEEHGEMPNFFSAFTSEVFRPLVTLLIPGAIAISTWLVGLLWHFHDLRTLVFNNHAEVGLVLVLAMTFAGLVLEDMGARVETWFDSRKEKQGGKHSDNWYAYLLKPAHLQPKSIIIGPFDAAFVLLKDSHVNLTNG